MAGESPDVVLYDVNGNMLAVQNGSATPASTPALMMAGSDGTNSRYITIDSSGRPVMVGAGTAGSPAGGVVSIQGVASGTTVPVTGTIGATQNGNIDAGNSSTVTLVGSGTFTGTGIDVSVYGVVSVFVFTDQAGTLNLEWSINGTNWDDVNSYAVSASTALSIQFGPQARFFRVVYQNGSSAQSIFRLQTIERPITAFPETVPASYVIQNSDNVLLTKNVQGTSPWVDNITQFGGTNISTGTGAGGAGIPRVTVSNDSNILATQSGSWTVTANQGTPNSNANKWPVQVTDGTHNMPTMDAIARAGFQEITDGTNGPVAVKAASTAAAAADPSLVVGLSPNSPLPAGTNIIGALSANQSVNVAQIAGSTTSTAATGVQKVGIVGSTGTALDGTTAGVLDENIKNVAGNAAATAATGVLKVGIVGSTGTALDGTTAGILDENLKNVGGSAVVTAATGVQKVGVVGNTGATTDAALTAGTAPTNGYGTLAQYNTSLPAPTNTQTVSLQSDQSGNLLNFPGAQTKTGTVWNSSTALNTLQFATGTATVGAALGGQAVILQLDQTTTITGGVVTIQGTYDGTNWVTVPVAQVLNPQTFAQLTNPYTFVANTNQPFLILLQGFQQIRLNLTTQITGTGSVSPFWTVLSNDGLAPSYLTDGIHGPVAVKASSTAPVAADQALVVVISPNQQSVPITTAPSTATTTGIAVGKILNSGSTSNVRIPILNTTYNEQSSNAQRSISSSSANDTAAGTGARTVTITYFTSDLVTKNTETVTLNGTTAVNTTNTNICFIESIVVATVGSNGSNVGTLTLFTTTGGGGTTITTIAPDVSGTRVGISNRTYFAQHYVQSGKTCTIVSFDAGTQGNANGEAFLASKDPTNANSPENQISDSITVGLNASTVPRQVQNTIKVAGPARVRMIHIPAGNGTAYFGSFDFWEQ